MELMTPESWVMGNGTDFPSNQNVVSNFHCQTNYWRDSLVSLLQAIEKDTTPLLGCM